MYKGYVTTNIRLPKEMWESLKNKALDEGKSLAQLFREGAMRVLGKEKLPKRKFHDDPFFKIIGRGDGAKDGSREHDKDLYGNKNFR
ncbi:MAG: hypothetical protein ABII74_06630 [Elusimicrobiota bacterium]